ncbi:MAG: Tyrosine recombinase XerD [Cryomorphaceae bacterium]|nr:MAG: Tyrosine recombinase XerD [Cryomorphaceae bacterium]
MNNSKKIGPLIGPLLDTFSIIFLLKMKKKNNKNLIPIYSRVTINGQRIELSTKRWIRISDWDKKKQRPKLINSKLKTLNHYLEYIRNRFYTEHHRLSQTNKRFSAIDLKNAYLNIKEKGLTVLEVIAEHNKDMKNQIPENYSEGTLKNYRTLIKHLSCFIKKSFKQDDIDIQQVDSPFIYKLERHLLFNTLCNQNGAMKVMQRFKKITTLSKRKGVIDNDPFEGYVFSFKRKEIEFLSQDEINRFSNLELSIESEKKTKELFLFALYTGLSYADIISLKWHQIHKDEGGSKYIFNKRKKTGETFIVPLLKPSIEILKNKTETDEGLIFEYISNAFLNRLLKKLAIKAQIFKNLTFHIARHSFATTITLNNDVPLITVSKMLGHTNVRTTQIYAKVLQKKVSSDMELLNKKLFE